MDNIEKFDQYVADIFNRLYSTFPRRIEISSADLLDVEPDENFRSEPGGNNVVPYYFKGTQKIAKVSTEDWKLAIDTIRWLIDSGFILGQIKDDRRGVGLTLSHKGLELLKMVPNSLNITIGEKLTEAVKAGAMDAAKEIIKKGLTNIGLLYQLVNLISR